MKFRDTQNHCGYKPEASVISKLATTYSNQGNVDGMYVHTYAVL